MTYIEKLISFHIIEREFENNLVTWSYPTIEPSQKKYILNNCFTRPHNGFICMRNGSTWFNIRQSTNGDQLFAVAILSTEFEPNKYKALSEILAKKYSKNQNPVELVSLYLNLYTSGKCSLQENGTTYLCNFKDFKSTTNLKELIQSFDHEIILIYTAILLKRRVILFNSNVENLINDLVDVYNLVPNRKRDDYIYPITENVNMLKGLSFFVTGTTDSNVVKDDHLYDIFVNMESREITISRKAEGAMSMTKTHKEISIFLVKLAASDLSETEVTKHIKEKTRDLINMLKNLAPERNMVTMQDIKQKKFYPNLENFIFNLAVAENMIIL